MNLTHHKNSKISVIVTIYNYEIFLEETINSLKSQQLSLHEIIIVDDASSDNSREVIQRLAADSSNVIPVLLEKNVGQLGAFNAGVARATGDIISFIDADDTWQPNYTAEVAQVFLKEPKCDYLFTGYRQFGDATGEFLTKPLFPALRSGPTAVTRPSRQKQIPSSAHVGSLTTVKRHDLLLKAYALSKQASPLLIIGKGPLEDAIHAQIIEFQLEEKVTLVGFTDNPYPYIKSATGLILSSQSESLPTVILEAFSLGTPVISTDCPCGPREMLPELNLAPTDDPVSLAKKIDQLVERPEDFCASLPSQFSEEHIINQYLSLT